MPEPTLLEELVAVLESYDGQCACHERIVRTLLPDAPRPCFGCQHRPCWGCRRDAVLARAWAADSSCVK